MKPPSEQQAMGLIISGLADLLGLSRSEIRVTRHPRRSPGLDVTPDALVEAGPFTFAVEWKGVAGAGAVAWAAKQARQYVLQPGKAAIPLVAVPYMGQVGSQVCAEAGVAWMDLSGNARIIAPGLTIIVAGKPNLFIRRGRPASAFAPKSSRIARWLLMHPDRPFTQREIAQATEMDEGFTSRIVTQLEKDELLTRNQAGAIRPRDPDLLLNAWREEYDFSRHHIIRGHIPALSGNALVLQVADELTKASIACAATGLAAAWLLDHFAGFRVVTVYIPEAPAPELLQSISFHEDDRGANVWLVVPDDDGVFHGAGIYDNVRCVHPVQVYLDLKGHPERSREAAEQLRAHHLRWKQNGR